jgi:protein-disulfide isomerase
MSGLKPPFNKADHYLGSPESPVQFVEFGDFQCPHCGAAYPMLKEIKKRYGSDMLFIFRHFPLTEVHPFAQLAAIATEAAARQGKFWEMHDLIFENQASLSREMLIGLAKVIHLEMKMFREDLEDPKLFEKVEFDFESGIKSGVNGTPSFYINGEKYNGPYTFQALAHAVDQVMSIRH